MKFFWLLPLFLAFVSSAQSPDTHQTGERNTRPKLISPRCEEIRAEVKKLCGKDRGEINALSELSRLYSQMTSSCQLELTDQNLYRSMRYALVKEGKALADQDSLERDIAVKWLRRLEIDFPKVKQGQTAELISEFYQDLGKITHPLRKRFLETVYQYVQRPHSATPLKPESIEPLTSDPDGLFLFDDPYANGPLENICTQYEFEERAPAYTRDPRLMWGQVLLALSIQTRAYGGNKEPWTNSELNLFTRFSDWDHLQFYPDRFVRFLNGYVQSRLVAEGAGDESTDLARSVVARPLVSSLSRQTGTYYLSPELEDEIPFVLDAFGGNLVVKNGKTELFVNCEFPSIRSSNPTQAHLATPLPLLGWSKVTIDAIDKSHFAVICPLAHRNFFLVDSGKNTLDLVRSGVEDKIVSPFDIGSVTGLLPVDEGHPIGMKLPQLQPRLQRRKNLQDRHLFYAREYRESLGKDSTGAMAGEKSSLTRNQLLGLLAEIRSPILKRTGLKREVVIARILASAGEDAQHLLAESGLSDDVMRSILLKNQLAYFKTHPQMLNRYSLYALDGMDEEIPLANREKILEPYLKDPVIKTDTAAEVLMRGVHPGEKITLNEELRHKIEGTGYLYGGARRNDELQKFLLARIGEKKEEKLRPEELETIIDFAAHFPLFKKTVADSQSEVHRKGLVRYAEAGEPEAVSKWLSGDAWNLPGYAVPRLPKSALPELEKALLPLLKDLSVTTDIADHRLKLIRLLSLAGEMGDDAVSLSSPIADAVNQLNRSSNLKSSVMDSLAKALYRSGDKSEKTAEALFRLDVYNQFEIYKWLYDYRSEKADLPSAPVVAELVDQLSARDIELAGPNFGRVLAKTLTSAVGESDFRPELFAALGNGTFLAIYQAMQPGSSSEGRRIFHPVYRRIREAAGATRLAGKPVLPALESRIVNAIRESQAESSDLPFLGRLLIELRAEQASRLSDRESGK